MRLLLVATLVTQALLAGSLVLTITAPNRRVWPPPSDRSWQFYFTWVASIGSIVGCLALGIFTWGSAPLALWLRFAVGAPLTVGGAAFALWGVRTLSSHASLGLGGDFIRRGPYRFTRNPQYVGNIVWFIGYALVSSSPAAVWACAVGSLWFLLAPFAEEPWLRAKHGEVYEEYRRQVPRFLWF